MKKQEFSLEVNGKKLIAEFNDWAENANGSVVLKYGATTILATAVMAQERKEAIDFFPLTVDYEEKFYASGQILGSKYSRREGKASDEAILSGRIVDRTIRPLFDPWIRNEIQIIITILALDEDEPDFLSVIAASLALSTSNIPFNGPVSSIRVAKHTEGDFQLNPSFVERENERAEIDLIACGKDHNINMIELGGTEAQEKTIVEALERASAEIEKINAWQKDIIAQIGHPKAVMPKPDIPESVRTLFDEKISGSLESYVMSGTPGPAKINEITEMWLRIAHEQLSEQDARFALGYIEERIDLFVHDQVLQHGKRPDGRGMDELRPLFAQAGGVSPVLHGSGLFYRGGTHILSVLTLGGPKDALVIEGMEERQDAKRFIHHYNFPPFSGGETGKMGTNRRMIGHGALAEKALFPMIPKQSDFPYTIRVVSEAFSSNGSTSMGSVCASTLALMDGGVPMKKPVAGIASGLMSDTQGRYKILTDIQGPEDHFGDMDFKVAGTKDGVTAIQMDIKVGGIPIPILAEAFEKAKHARFAILDVMQSALAKPRPTISAHAPEIIVITIRPEQIGGVIGSGGKTIKHIKEKKGAEIEIEDDGTIYITGKNGTAAEAKAIIESMTHEYRIGEKFMGEIVRIEPFGAFVNIGYETDGLVHISEIADFRIENIHDYLRIGEKVPVVIKEIDDKKRINLSIKSAAAGFIQKKPLHTEKI